MSEEKIINEETVETVEEVEKKEDKVYVKTNLNEYLTDVVIIASGTKENKLNIKGEEEFFHKGISFCAVCAYFYLFIINKFSHSVKSFAKIGKNTQKRRKMRKSERGV